MFSSYYIYSISVFLKSLKSRLLHRLFYFNQISDFVTRSSVDLGALRFWILWFLCKKSDKCSDCYDKLVSFLLYWFRVSLPRYVSISPTSTTIVYVDANVWSCRSYDSKLFCLHFLSQHIHLPADSEKNNTNDLFITLTRNTCFTSII